MATNAVVPSEKKSFREAFFAEAKRTDPDKKTIWEVIVAPLFIATVLFAAVTLVIAIIAFVNWYIAGQGEAHAVGVVGTAVQSLLT